MLWGVFLVSIFSGWGGVFDIFTGRGVARTSRGGGDGPPPGYAYALDYILHVAC